MKTYNVQQNEKYKPLVSILMAIYKPNYKWLKEQLKSLNLQTYSNLELIIYDDCPNEPLNEEIVIDIISNFTYKIIRGKKNMGSNRAFEELTKVSNGEFLSYCDQDDIWESNKIEIMMDSFTDAEIKLVCCDLSIIDEDGIKIAESIRDIRKRIKYKRGYNLAKELLISNFVTGCAMIVRRETAIKAIPFEYTLVHDNWIAITAALDGKIEFINKQLIRYRQHSNNQTGILKGVEDKQTYYEIKIIKLLERYKSLKKRLNKYEQISKYIDYCIYSLDIRKEYFENPSFSLLLKMIRYSDYYRLSILLEIFQPIIPEFAFKYIISLTKRGIL